MADRKSYSEMSQLDTYEDRLAYLSDPHAVGANTFAPNRYLNQAFYRSREWRDVCERVAIRDNGCDLGIEGMDLQSYKHLAHYDRLKHRTDYIPNVHHINPVTEEQILNRDPSIFDLDNLVLCSGSTHRKIHYGYRDEKLPDANGFTARAPNDTTPWKRGNAS